MGRYGLRAAKGRKERAKAPRTGPGPPEWVDLLTVSVRPRYCTWCIIWMAYAPSASVRNSMKPKPFTAPVAWSVRTLQQRASRQAPPAAGGKSRCGRVGARTGC